MPPSLDQRISDILADSDKPLKAMKIASLIGGGVTRRDVNEVLYGRLKRRVRQNSLYQWSLVGQGAANVDEFAGDQTMSRYRRSRGRRRRSRTAGHEAALKNIEEARQLSAELGGTDKDVKDYFFHLSPSELERVLDQYEEQFGLKAREYAEERGIPGWKSGRIKMSGMVAERLFKLLPPLMPLEKKSDLLQSLWNHVCPTTRKEYVIRSSDELDAVCEQIRQDMNVQVESHQTSEEFNKRFNWLAGDDAQLQQQLHNHYKLAWRTQVSDAVSQRLANLRERLSNVSAGRAEQTFEILNHKFVVRIQPERNVVHTSIHRDDAVVSSAGRRSGHKTLQQSSSTGCLATIAVLFFAGLGAIAWGWQPLL